MEGDGICILLASDFPLLIIWDILEIEVKLGKI